MSTPTSIATQALLKCGVQAQGTAALTTDITNAVQELANMLGQWQRRRYLNFRLIDLACPCTGQVTYGIGVGATDIPLDFRPDKLDAVYARLLNGNGYASQPQFQAGQFNSQYAIGSLGYGVTSPGPVDYKLTEIESREDWSGVGLKGLTTFPRYFFYDPGYPLATLYVWPLVTQSPPFELHIVFKAPFAETVVSGPGTDMGFPPEYDEAVVANLAIRLRTSYGLDPDPALQSIAAAALSTIRAANTTVSRLRTDIPQGRRGGVSYLDVLAGYY